MERTARLKQLRCNTLIRTRGSQYICELGASITRRWQVCGGEAWFEHGVLNSCDIYINTHLFTYT